MPKPKKPRQAKQPKSSLVKQSPHHRSVFSEQQFVHIEGDLVMIHFMSRSRDYEAGTVKIEKGLVQYVYERPVRGTPVEIEEFSVKVPVQIAMNLASVIGGTVFGMGRERLKALGLEVEAAPVSAMGKSPAKKAPAKKSPAKKSRTKKK